MVKFTHGYSKKSHLDFIKRYLQQLRKDEVVEKPKLFGNLSYEEYKQKATSNYHKIIISPETPMDIEQLQEFTKCFMKQFENETHRKYDWMASVHTNTAHPHVHIVLNGKDQDGKTYRVSPDFVKSFCRQNAQELLTLMNGERTQEQIDAARNSRPLSNRWTEYDEAIEKSLNEVNFNGDDCLCLKATDAAPEVAKRLEHLEELGITKTCNGNFIFKKNWKEELKAAGRYNNYLDAKRYIDIDSELRLYKTDMGKISGKIRHIYYMDEENTWNNAVLVEDEKTHRAYYVPLYKPLEHHYDGETITVATRTNQKGKLSAVIDKQFTGRYRKETDETKSKNKDGQEY